MNNKRRNELKKLQARLVKITASLREVCQEVEHVHTAEQEALDNMPESIREGDKGQSIQVGLDIIQSIVDSIDEAICDLELADIFDEAVQ